MVDRGRHARSAPRRPGHDRKRARRVRSWPPFAAGTPERMDIWRRVEHHFSCNNSAQEGFQRCVRVTKKIRTVRIPAHHALLNPHRSHVARMLAHPVPTTFQPYSRRAGRSSCCWPKSWPKLLFGSNLVQAHAATNSFMSGLPTSEMRPERLLTVPKSIAAAAAHARGHSGPLQLATALT